jgi:hypothetical protein
MKPENLDENESETKKAILWGRDDILGNAVAILFDPLNHWRVIRVFDECDIGVLTREVEKENPEVVVINMSDLTGKSLPPIHLREGRPELKIITIDPESNLIGIYNRQVISIKNMSDLKSVIDGPCDSSRTEGSLLAIG